MLTTNNTLRVKDIDMKKGIKVLWEGKNKIWTVAFAVVFLLMVFQDQIKALF